VFTANSHFVRAVVRMKCGITHVAMFGIAVLMVTALRRALLLHAPVLELSSALQPAGQRRQPIAVTGARGAVEPEVLVPPPPPPQPLLSGELSDALALAVPAGRGLVMLTFGNSGVRQMLINFVAHARAADIPFVVGAVDRAVFTLLARQSVAVYETPLSKQAGYALDGSNAHASGSWMSFAQMRSGEVARVVALGFDVLHTDVDVAWLRSPMPYLACAHEDADADAGATTTTTSSAAATSRWPRGAFSCASLKAADVAVSTDNMSPREEAANGVGYTAGGTFNTGLLLIRATAAGKRFARAWHASVVERACPAGRPGDCNPGRCCTSDQQVFNRMVRDEKFYPGLKVPHGGGRTVYSPKANVTLGALPLALFLHGHGYFVQVRRDCPRDCPIVHPLFLHGHGYFVQVRLSCAGGSAGGSART
jgi:hypothetical protein